VYATRAPLSTQQISKHEGGEVGQDGQPNRGLLRRARERTRISANCQVHTENFCDLAAAKFEPTSLLAVLEWRLLTLPPCNFFRDDMIIRTGYTRLN
jgi:hypothetical protein